MFQGSSDYAQALATRCAAGVAFAREPISTWTTSCDLRTFLTNVFDQEFQRTSDTGQVETGNFKSYGETLFNDGRETFLEHAATFRANAEAHADSPHPSADFSVRVDDIPHFESDVRFASMAKAAIAWDGLVDGILSESLFFSLPHTVEARSELDCSILLASNLYYKQALQVLRGLVELSVLHLYFAANHQDYRKWEVADYRVPSLRAKKTGLLAMLESQRLLPPELSAITGNLYEALNGAIHSTENRLIHSGLFQGQWAGLQYKDDQFADWCGFVVRAVDVGTRLMGQTLRVAASASKVGIICNVCHTSNSFDVVDAKTTVPGFETVRCRKCGNSRTLEQPH